MAKTVILLGWPGAHWAHATPLLEQGLLPNLSAVIRSGGSGVLRGFAGLEPALAISTLVTGCPPDEVQSGAPTVWLSLSEQGISAFAQGWTGHSPFASGDPKAPLHAPLRTQDIDPGLIGFFASKEALAKPDVANRLQGLLPWLASVYTTHNASILAADQGTRFIAPGHVLIDQVSTAFLSRQAEPDYAGVIPGAYRLMDALLGDLLRHCSGDTDVVVASDHGFHESGGRSPYGLLAARGEAWPAGSLLGSLALTEVVPRVLQALGAVPNTEAVAGQKRARPAPIPPSTPAETAFSVGSALLDLDRPEDACAWLHHALLRAPEARKVAFSLGQALLRSGLAGEAFHYAAATFDAGDASTRAVLLKAEIAIALNREKEALAWLATLSPSAVSLESEGLRRHALLKAGRGAEAEASFHPAIADNPHEPLLLIGLAHAQILNGHLPAARDSVERATRMAPHHAALPRLRTALAGEPLSPPPWESLKQASADHDRLRRGMEEQESTFSADRFAARKGQVAGGEQPVAERAESSTLPWPSHLRSPWPDELPRLQALLRSQTLGDPPIWALALVADAPERLVGAIALRSSQVGEDRRNAVIECAVLPAWRTPEHTEALVSRACDAAVALQIRTLISTVEIDSLLASSLIRRGFSQGMAYEMWTLNPRTWWERFGRAYGRILKRTPGEYPKPLASDALEGVRALCGHFKLLTPERVGLWPQDPQGFDPRVSFTLSDERGVRGAILARPQGRGIYLEVWAQYEDGGLAAASLVWRCTRACLDFGVTELHCVVRPSDNPDLLRMLARGGARRTQRVAPFTFSSP